ncbi:Hypothetical predicted protein [Podarcis lilfordi]|uniref:Uncharacterized protein n=1 Tax=Podarcis lilfordi TaxID=74358 RepID=A0AA35KPS5_9SAUR|nr:Hypothetical predicted protein [Podarcis lilfordi]
MSFCSARKGRAERRKGREGATPAEEAPGGKAKGPQRWSCQWGKEGPVAGEQAGRGGEAVPGTCSRPAADMTQQH